MTHRIKLIRGDGIGPEVSEAAPAVVEATGVDVRWDVQEAGQAVMEREGEPLPDRVLDSIRASGTALKGPITTPVGTGFRSVNVALRQELDLYASVRPCRLYPGVPSRFEGVDIVVVRENTEDVYEGIEFEQGSREVSKLRGYLSYMHGFPLAADAGVSIKPISISATKAIVDFTFEYAKRYRRRKVTLGHKANIMRFSDGVWLETGERRAEDYRDVGFEAIQVDELAMWLAWHPEEFDVIVLPNLYGDVISDLCAACTTSCPIFWGDEGYVGPAAIVNAHRFIFDSRDQGARRRLDILGEKTGVFRCRTTFNCTEACPRGIKVTQAIQEVKSEIMFDRLG